MWKLISTVFAYFSTIHDPLSVHSNRLDSCLDTNLIPLATEIFSHLHELSVSVRCGGTMPDVESRIPLFRGKPA